MRKSAEQVWDGGGARRAGGCYLKVRLRRGRGRQVPSPLTLGGGKGCGSGGAAGREGREAAAFLPSPHVAVLTAAAPARLQVTSPGPDGAGVPHLCQLLVH